MKKNKVLTLVEIAILLCSVFLVAPALAADQTTQKVSASTVTAASEIYEPGPLDVFGNANEDNTIDMRDTTYIKLVIFGKKPRTDLADANYDGKVSMLDVGQTKLIILGKEKKLTYIDILGEAETVNKPIKRLANLGWAGLDLARSLDAMDIQLPVVGWDRSSQPICYPEFSKWPVVGYTVDNCDFEYVLSLHPDAVQTNIERSSSAVDGLETKRVFQEKFQGIPLISLNMREIGYISRTTRTYGYIIDRKDEAEEFVDWWEGYYNLFKSRTEGLSEDERPRVYVELWRPYLTPGSGNRFGQPILLAGGYNIVDQIVGPDDPEYVKNFQVDPEWVIEQNPEFIFKDEYKPYGETSYETDNPTVFAAARQKILDRPELANVDTVKNKRVYIIYNDLLTIPGLSIIGPAYMGKVLQPELFKDIDPRAMHQEFIDRFCPGLNFNVREHGVFVYPPYEEWSV
jgi:iron complex transport system substrate-binding protein